MPKTLHKRKPPGDYQHSETKHVKQTILHDSTLIRESFESIAKALVACARAALATPCFLNNSPFESNAPRASGAVGVSAMVSGAPGRSGNSAKRSFQILNLQCHQPGGSAVSRIS